MRDRVISARYPGGTDYSCHDMGRYLLVSGWTHHCPSSVQYFSAFLLLSNPRSGRSGHISCWVRPGKVELKQDQESKMMGQLVVLSGVLGLSQDIIVEIFMIYKREDWRVDNDILPGGKSSSAFHQAIKEILRGDIIAGVRAGHQIQ